MSPTLEIRSGDVNYYWQVIGDVEGNVSTGGNGKPVHSISLRNSEELIKVLREMGGRLPFLTQFDYIIQSNANGKVYYRGQSVKRLEMKGAEQLQLCSWIEGENGATP